MHKFEKNNLRMDEIEFRVDSELILGGLYVQVTTKKYALEEKINLKKLKIFFISILISSSFLGSPIHAKSIKQNQPTNISKVDNDQNNERSDKNFSIGSDQKKNLPKKKIQKSKFDPFSSEIKEEIEKQISFIFELQNFNEKKVLNQNTFSFKKNENGIFVKPTSIVLLANNKTENKYSTEEKKFYTKKMISVINFVRRYKLLIFSFFIGTLIIVIYIFFKVNKISLLTNKLTTEKSLNFINPEKMNNSSEISKTETNLTENFSSQIIEEVPSVENIDSNSILEPTSKTEQIIFPESEEISLNQLQDIKVCIEKGKALKSRESELELEIGNLLKVKDHFVEFGDQSFENEEDWMSLAKGIKSEMDRLFQERIEWEKDLSLFLESCQ
jgi:hypothetical protein